MAILRLSDGSEARLHIVPPTATRRRRVGKVERIEPGSPGAVWVENPIGEGWMAAFRILPASDGSPVVAEVRVFPDHARRHAGTWAAERAGVGLLHLLGAETVADLVPTDGLTSRRLRQVKMPGAAMFTRRIMREFVKGWGELGGDAAAAFFTPHGLDPKAAPRSGPGRKPIGDLTLAKAAEIYVDALGRPGGPIKAVCDAFPGTAHGTACGWIAKARDPSRGLLTRTPKGTAGGALTERAIRLLRNERRRGKKR